jgi:hypothetical protein
MIKREAFRLNGLMISIFVQKLILSLEFLFKKGSKER